METIKKYLLEVLNIADELEEQGVEELSKRLRNSLNELEKGINEVEKKLENLLAKLKDTE